MANIPIRHEEVVSLTNLLTTELNALADDASVLSAAIDNTDGAGNGAHWLALELAVAEQAGARDADAHVAVYLLKSLDDGTTFDYGDASNAPPTTAWVGNFVLDAAVTARASNIIVPAPTGKFKVLVTNVTGQAFAATTNTLKYALFTDKLVTA